MSDSWAGRQVVGHRIGAVEYVLRDLTDSIHSGIVEVGERLPAESALAARYGVSRSVIREVLRICEAQGLTTTRNGRGTFVASQQGDTRLVFGEFSAAHLIEARPHVEVPAAGLAAIRRSEAQVTALQELHEQMQAETNAEAWVQLDISFHGAIAAASGNPIFQVVLESISGALSSQSSLLNLGPGRRESADIEHRGIVSAIARGSVAEAEDAMEFHLDQVKEALSHAAGTTPRGPRHDYAGHRLEHDTRGAEA
ncbi:FadR/GntR family transcriptional regulator [Agromyces albus]|uniref:FadR/GntR family transcriptional regulator n=1 Tax=Agromyces albus TaxID=205332 RepID=UPI0027D82265|nr:FadR/GntR family transcriptional regulator [Agromyces albus]